MNRSSTLLHLSHLIGKSSSHKHEKDADKRDQPVAKDDIGLASDTQSHIPSSPSHSHGLTAALFSNIASIRRSQSRHDKNTNNHHFHGFHQSSVSGPFVKLDPFDKARRKSKVTIITSEDAEFKPDVPPPKESLPAEAADLDDKNETTKEPQPPLSSCESARSSDPLLPDDENSHDIAFKVPNKPFPESTPTLCRSKTIPSLTFVTQSRATSPFTNAAGVSVCDKNVGTTPTTIASVNLLEKPSEINSQAKDELKTTSQVSEVPKTTPQPVATGVASSETLDGPKLCRDQSQINTEDNTTSSTNENQPHQESNTSAPNFGTDKKYAASPDLKPTALLHPQPENFEMLKECSTNGNSNINGQPMSDDTSNASDKNSSSANTISDAQNIKDWPTSPTEINFSRPIRRRHSTIGEPEYNQYQQGIEFNIVSDHFVSLQFFCYQYFFEILRFSISNFSDLSFKFES